MTHIFKTRWRGHRVRVEFSQRDFIYGGQGQTPCLTIKTSNATADRLGLPSIQRYKVNADIIETIGNTEAYAKKLFRDAVAKIQQRQQFQIRQQIHLFGRLKVVENRAFGLNHTRKQGYIKPAPQRALYRANIMLRRKSVALKFYI